MRLEMVKSLEHVKNITRLSKLDNLFVQNENQVKRQEKRRIFTSNAI